MRVDDAELLGPMSSMERRCCRVERRRNALAMVAYSRRCMRCFRASEASSILGVSVARPASLLNALC